MATGLPTSVAVEIEYTSGVWTAVTTSVIGDSLTIRVGRTPASSSQPGPLSFDLSNTDGTYTPDNPLSTVYPNFVEGKRVRGVVVKGAATSYRFVGWITLLQPTLPVHGRVLPAHGHGRVRWCGRYRWSQCAVDCLVDCVWWVDELRG